MTEKWLAYERYGRGTDHYFTIKLESETVSGVAPVSVRDATSEEIADEKAKRAELVNRRVLRAKFEDRQDYQDAKAVNSVLEWIEYDKHPLDRLTPAEWADLARRLTA
jgi:hypothetical protein